jgi:SAM-dependent methyltransferase
MSLVEALDRRFYDREAGWVDATTRFAQMIEAHLRPGMTILDLGAGPYTDEPLMLKRKGIKVIGLDPGADIAANPALDEKLRGVAEAIPIRSESVDLVFSNWVAEHLPDPLVAAEEVRRVMRRGGKFLFRTGNLRHYVYTVASLTPHWFHELVANRIRRLPNAAYDPYPTYYRFNTLAQVRRVMAEAGFIENELTAIESNPSYMVFSPPSFILGLAYERIVNRFDALANLRGTIIGCFVKP